MNDIIKKRVLEAAQDTHKNFSASLIPNINNVLGVKIPVLRKISKEIYSSNNWKNFLTFYKEEYMEETMLKGMVIGHIKASPEKILSYIKDFVPKIDNWAVCDTFCSSLKFSKKNRDLVWQFIQPYLYSTKEYEIRFGVVMALNYFVEKEYIKELLNILDKINHDGYYAKMAVAWAVSICFVKEKEITFDYLKNSHLNNWTYNKSIQKIIESYRVSDEDKSILRNMKK